jgi:para-aminobenzoate synthetase / 4-amino-4-deoxychorismate lyase
VRRWHVFSQPRGLLVARSRGEVLPLLVEVEAASRRGLHAVGFLAYEAAPAFDPALVTRPSAGLLACFGLFASARPWRAGSAPRWRDSHGLGRLPLEWRPSVGEGEHREAVRSIRQAIARGETYQVNYTYRLRAPFDGEPWGLFCRMVARQPVPHGVFLDFGELAVCSASPELFFSRSGHQITCRPMKGTAPRGRWAGEDEALGRELGVSAKDRAENLMIVDMMRNDLGRVARPGSVSVPRLYQVERYTTLWQMTSTITAESPAPLPDLLAALFPAASITGAPKRSAMARIAALEREPRGVYTGAAGWVGPGGRVELNVAIRTVVVDRTRGVAEYGTGGGVVWDSEAARELAEARAKAGVLLAPAPRPFRLLETLLWRPRRGWFLLGGHLGRLAASARYFGFRLPGDLRTRLDELAAELPPRRHRVRLLLSRRGEAVLAAEPLARRPRRPRRLALAGDPVDPADPFLFHKTTRREPYRRALASAPGCEDVLLWNPRDELTESAVANLVVELDGRRVTPPLACGLLPGVFRGHLLARGVIEEAVVRKEDLTRVDAIWLVSSLRGWVRGKMG